MIYPYDTLLLIAVFGFICFMGICVGGGGSLRPQDDDQ